MRLHIDTDFGSNPDDACALAMVLGWPHVEVTAVTTTADGSGERAEQVRRLLAMVGRADIVVAAPLPHSGTATAQDRLLSSIAMGAHIVAIGPWTNLAVLEELRPGALSGVPVTVTGGWVVPPGPGLPRWRADRDTNVQSDTAAAHEVFTSGAALTLVPISATLDATLRHGQLPGLRATGRLGRLLASRSEAHGEVRGYGDLGDGCWALPDDLVNFHFDPVTCAVALGWPGVAVDGLRLRPAYDAGALRFEQHPAGRRTRVVTAVDGDAFAETWLAAVRAAQTGAAQTG